MLQVKAKQASQSLAATGCSHHCTATCWPADSPWFNKRHVRHAGYIEVGKQSLERKNMYKDKNLRTLEKHTSSPLLLPLMTLSSITSRRW
jgi:hypothetical protein